MSSIEITIDNLTTFRTSPFSVFQGKGIINPSTRKTPLAGRKESVNLPKMSSSPFGFIFKLANELRPTTVSDTFGKTVVSYDTLHMQIFGVDSLVFANQPMTQFVKKIFSLIGNLFMNASNFYSLKLFKNNLDKGIQNATKAEQEEYFECRKMDIYYIRLIRGFPRNQEVEG